MDLIYISSFVSITASMCELWKKGKSENRVKLQVLPD